MRISDWSSDVCSSDLVGALVKALTPKPDVVFNALHGRFGEDGSIQGVLDLMGIPYTHSGLLASALAMDKAVAKRAFAAAGIVCPDGRVIDASELMAGDPLPRPYVVKPNGEGSSVGVRIVRARSEEHTSELPSLMRSSYAVFGLKKK